MKKHLNGSLVAMALMATMAAPIAAPVNSGASNPSPRVVQQPGIIREKKARRGVSDRVIEPVRDYGMFGGGWRNVCNHPLHNHARNKKGKR